MLAAVIVWPAVTLTPLSFSVPSAGRVTMVTDCRVSPAGPVSGKLAAAKV